MVVQHLKEHAEYIVIGRVKWFADLGGERVVLIMIVINVFALGCKSFTRNKTRCLGRAVFEDGIEEVLKTKNGGKTF